MIQCLPCHQVKIPTALTEEQKERMRRNRELAAVKRREKEQREAELREMEEDQDNMEEIEKEIVIKLKLLNDRKNDFHLPTSVAGGVIGVGEMF